MTLGCKHVLVAVAILAPLLSHAQSFTLVFAGGAGGDDRSPALTRLEQRVRSLDPKRAVVVFTGNYSVGELPEEGAPGRADAERDVLAHVNATRDFVTRGGKVYFLAGHRDFAAGGTRAIRRLRDFLNQSYAADLDVMPTAGCGDPVMLDLADDLGLVLMNSQWWMLDWDTDPLANEGCEVKTREAFATSVRDAFNEYRTQRMIVASHHPLRSHPALGGLEAPARAAGLVPHTPNHPTVRAWVQLVGEEAERYGAFVFASGHDANLQFLRDGRQAQLVAGTLGGAVEAPARPDPGEFAAAFPGWAELVIAPGGGGETRLVSGLDATVLFAAKVEPLPSFAAAVPPTAPPLPKGPVKVAFAKTPSRPLGPISRFFLGTFYSPAYELELPWEVLDLKTEQGGLVPYKTGGSLQTNSLALRDRHGGVWTMRAVRKDPSRFLGRKHSDSNSAVSHGFTATHPEAALSVAVLAKAVGVLHAEPRLMYLPDQEALGRFRGYIADELVLLERSPKEPDEGVLPQTLAGKPSPAGRTRFRSTDQTLAKVTQSPATHRVDQEAMLRARLLDVFIGDWDRHPEQWRFAAIPNADGTITYQPIPRDRDQAFAHYDGAALMLARASVKEPRALQVFTPHYGSLEWLIYGARHLDPVLLNRLPRDRWLAIAAQMKAALTDAVIDEAMSTWHRETFELHGAKIAATLKLRRDKLEKVAGAYFDLLSEKAEVVGSAEDDVFQLWFEEDGKLRLAVRTVGAEGAPWFDRVFDPLHTAELRLYALSGDDVLEVHGVPHRAIDIRFAGGPGADRVTAAGAAPTVASAIHLNDNQAGAVIEPSIAVTDERSDLAHLNQYDPTEHHEANVGVFIPGLRANADDGLLVGGRYSYLVHGFKKHPYAGKHELTVTFATATVGAAIDYRAVFPQSAELLDQQLDLVLRAPTYTRNYFGITNRIVDEGEPLDVYRVRQPAIEGRYGLFYGFSGDRSRAGAQVVTQAIGAEGQGTRFFAGGRLSGSSHTFDDLLLPTSGVGLSASIENRFDLERGNQFSTNYKVEGALAFPFDRKRRFVLLSRARFEAIVGEHPFYFAPTLGSAQLRAYLSDQLAGDIAFAQTSDLRLELFRSRSILPGKLGVNVSVDHGRVFAPSITDDTYHLSLGGSVWWSIMDAFVLSAGYYRGLNGGSRFNLVIGPLFAPPAI